MRKFRFSLRFKLTAIVAGVMSICCLLLTAVSLSTSAQMVEALPLMQPVLTFPADSDTTGAVSCEPAQIASVAQDRFQTQNLAAMVLLILAGSAAAYLACPPPASPVGTAGSQCKGPGSRQYGPDKSTLAQYPG